MEKHSMQTVTRRELGGYTNDKMDFKVKNCYERLKTAYTEKRPVH